MWFELGIGPPRRRRRGGDHPGSLRLNYARAAQLKCISPEKMKRLFIHLLDCKRSKRKVEAAGGRVNLTGDNDDDFELPILPIASPLSYLSPGRVP